MKIIRTVEEMSNISGQCLQNNQIIGFVPTMGYLHEGHLTLMRRAKEENNIVVASVFVNPLQFGPNEDYDAYPRDLQRDERLAKSVGVDYLFCPTVQEMYPDEMTVEIKVKKRVDVLCGRKRVGHFDGVATVLVKLFSIIRPHHVYFGLKDAQQVAVVDGLIKDLNLPITLRPVETVREEDGLAKSSRNVNLTEAERQEAPFLYQSLVEAKERIFAGERDPDVIIAGIKQFLQNKVNGKIDYVEIYSYPELKPQTRLTGKIIIAIAVQFSKARLIDNIILELKGGM
ncbi:MULTISPECIES: pantoate--beta-alanine ligase [Bacillaceae]|jgi:pantoate--beta-alanine ligase|uniref:pantoate--beta-alanine ligase n=1 Tax=Bacillaceae TaxID=186817 RepID=UPI0005A445AB|nr:MULTISPECIES: pantoate--beta-alanine ligase [Bacillaceae]KIO65619.1 Pantoate--beta-alanine ligase [Caldibacillus thermoamylovorans]MEC5270411.1 pantoate--beta-alanine ligase [Caldifermentibacillus hisashii]MED4853564.1 pantoate--beta-alanine ligase [Caldifermentibacillus hisashii]NWN96189.1 pantoate--beta-alanine ligase [Bacillus sp. (in: firmicutes)]